MNGTTIMVTTPRLLDQARGEIRLKHYHIRIEQVYLDWIKRFICHFGKRHPNEIGALVAGKVVASTQNQAKSAPLFLYRDPRMRRA